jgi:hypothetical protein
LEFLPKVGGVKIPSRQDVAVAKADYFNALLGQISVSCHVVLPGSRKAVPVSVGFNGEPGFRTVEIHGVWADGNLPPELVTGKVTSPDQTPQGCLRRGLFPAQTSGAARHWIHRRSLNTDW